MARTTVRIPMPDTNMSVDDIFRMLLDFGFGASGDNNLEDEGDGNESNNLDNLGEEEANRIEILNESKIHDLCINVLSKGSTLKEVKECISKYEISFESIKEYRRRIFNSICGGGKVSVLKFFIEKLTREYLEETNAFGHIIGQSIRSNRLNFIKHLVSNLKIDISDVRYVEFGTTPLLAAISYDKLTILKYFFENSIYDMTHSVICYACKFCNLKTVKYLLDQIPLNERCIMIHENNEYALRNACDGLNFGVIKHLVSDYNVDVRVLNDEPFKLVVKSKKLDKSLSKRVNIVKYLMKQSKGRINIRANNDWAFRYSASSYGDFCIAIYCLQHGADVHSNNEEALLSAGSMGNLSRVKHLIERSGANPHARGGELLFMAAQYGYVDIVEYLIDACGMDVSRITESMLQIIGQENPTFEQYIRTKQQRTDVPEWVHSTDENGKDKDKKTMNCGICLDTVSDIIAFEPCGHVLCKDCCYNMYKRCDDKCPFCRVVIKKRNRYSDIVDKTKLFI